MLRHQVFCACRKDRQGHARLFVEQGGHGTITADGNEAATPRVAGRPEDERRSFLRSRRNLLDNPARRNACTNRCTDRKPPPIPELRLTTIPTQPPSPGSGRLASTRRRPSYCGGKLGLVSTAGGVRPRSVSVSGERRSEVTNPSTWITGTANVLKALSSSMSVLRPAHGYSVGLAERLDVRMVDRFKVFAKRGELAQEFAVLGLQVLDFRFRLCERLLLRCLLFNAMWRAVFGLLDGFLDCRELILNPREASPEFESGPFRRRTDGHGGR